MHCLRVRCLIGLFWCAHRLGALFGCAHCVWVRSLVMRARLQLFRREATVVVWGELGDRQNGTHLWAQLVAQGSTIHAPRWWERWHVREFRSATLTPHHTHNHQTQTKHPHPPAPHPSHIRTRAPPCAARALRAAPRCRRMVGVAINHEKAQSLSGVCEVKNCARPCGCTVHVPD